MSNNIASKEYKNVYVSVPLFDKGRTLSRTYDIDKLTSILSQITYGLITVPLFAYRNEYTGNDDNRGNFIVGWVDGFNTNTNMFDVCILEKFSDILDKYDQDIMIYPRVKFIGRTVVSVVGLDLCERKYYSVINR